MIIQAKDLRVGDHLSGYIEVKGFEVVENTIMVPITYQAVRVTYGDGSYEYFDADESVRLDN